MLSSKSKKKVSEKNIPEPIAIIGLGSLFPGLSGTDGYWATIKNGLDTFQDIPKNYWLIEDYYDPDPKAKDKTYGRRGGFLTPVNFDPLKYGIPPKDLSAIDSTQLLGLIVATEALTDAGYAPDSEYDHSKTSVMLGVTGALKLLLSLGTRLAQPQIRRSLKDSGASEDMVNDVLERFSNEFPQWQENSFPGLLGNVTAGRIANRLNLGGTNMVLDAACGSSLAAIKQAVMELRSKTSDLVISGGMDTFSDYFMYTCFSKTPALSPSGELTAYDRNGDGTMLGDGLGVVVLKRLEDAKADGDRIYAIIRSVGASSDGKGTAIFAPSVNGQIRALKSAYEQVDVQPSTVDLVEGHGTGTNVGDSVEVEALSTVYQSASLNVSEPYCALGSVKSQIGHTKAAAGVAGLIKVALSLYHKVLPPTIKVREPIDKLLEKNSPLYLNTELRPWINASSKHPRRAALSAFGFGGTNFHCLLEEHETSKPKIELDEHFTFLALSADNLPQLSEKLINITKSDFLARSINEQLKHFNPHHKLRLTAVSNNSKLLVTQLKECHNTLLSATSVENLTQKDFPENIYFGANLKPPKIAFVYSDHSELHDNMYKNLALVYPEFLDALDEVSAICSTIKGLSPLNQLLYPPKLVRSDISEFWRKGLINPLMPYMLLAGFGVGFSSILNRFNIKADCVLGLGAGNLLAAWSCGCLSSQELFNLMEAKALQVSSKSVIHTRSYYEHLDKLIFKKNISSPFSFYSSNLPYLVKNEDFLKKSLKYDDDLDYFDNAVKNIVKQGVELWLEIGSSAVLEPRIKELSHNATVLSFSSDSDDFFKLNCVLARLAALGHNVDFTSYLNRYPQADSEKKFTVSLSGANIFEKKQIPPKKNLKPIIEESMVSENKNSLQNIENNSLIEAISKITQETAKIHQVFLENQKSALELLKNISLKNSNGPTCQNKIVKKTELSSIDKTIIDFEQALQDKNLETLFADKTATIESNDLSFQSAAKALQQNSFENKKIENVVFDIIARETGYPLEMLSLNMNLEDDLGLDSIKKVEVMAALKDSWPNFESFADSDSLKTIGDIVSLFSQSEDAAVTAVVAKKESIKHDLQSESNSEQEILALISNETGYPLEMLNENMDLEADLGLDSIKRVEIMAALADNFPVFASLSSDSLNDARTIGDLFALLGNFKNDSKILVESKNFEKSDDYKAKVFEILSKETGYPEEMLRGDMSLESDLGLDSIKRVEIMAALAEVFPESMQVGAFDQHIDSNTTLNDLLSYIVGDMENESDSSNKTSDKDMLYDLVSKETGYPLELLKDNMSIEDDLGLDSIKRVEIMAALNELYPDNEPFKADFFNQIKTLGDLRKLIDLRLDKTLVNKVSSNKGKNGKKQETLWQPVLKKLDINSLKAHSFVGKNVWLLAEQSVLIDNFEKILSVDKNVKRFDYKKKIKFSKTKADTLIMVWPQDQTDENIITNALEALKAFQQAATKESIVVSITFNGGEYGLTDLKLKENSEINYHSAAFSGLIKSFFWENPDILVKNIDLPLSAEKQQLNNWAESLNKIIFSDTPLELVLPKANELATIELIEADIVDKKTQPFLSDGDTLLVTGGARGVTAEVLKTLTEKYRLKLLIVGQTPLGPPEPSWLAELNDENAIKKQLHKILGANLSPKEISVQSSLILKTREIRNNLHVFENNGSIVEYHACALDSFDDLAEIINQFTASYGAINAFIHGAGVLSDSLIKDKKLEDFLRVYNTKVKLAEKILTLISSDKLKIVAFFSSSSARFGRRGQSDYAAGNEVLNKLAVFLNKAGLKTLSVNWGPWDGGMVNKNLAALFKKEKIGLINLTRGANIFLRMLENDLPSSEILVLGPETDLTNLLKPLSRDLEETKIDV